MRRTVARTLCNPSLRTASGPEGSSAKQTLVCGQVSGLRWDARPQTSPFMSYQVLARKWRPQRFDDVIGQQAVTRTLRNAIASGRIAHSFRWEPGRVSFRTGRGRPRARTLQV